MLAVQMDWDLFHKYKDAVSPVTLWGVMIAVVVACWLVFHLRARFREDSGRADGKLEMLTQFRELRQQGELTEDEYRLIKSRLAREAADLMAVTPRDEWKSAVSAEQGVCQEDGTEKTGETGNDDGDL